MFRQDKNKIVFEQAFRNTEIDPLLDTLSKIKKKYKGDIVLDLSDTVATDNLALAVINDIEKDNRIK